MANRKNFCTKCGVKHLPPTGMRCPTPDRGDYSPDEDSWVVVRQPRGKLRRKARAAGEKKHEKERARSPGPLGDSDGVSVSSDDNTKMSDEKKENHPKEPMSEDTSDTDPETGGMDGADGADDKLQVADEVKKVWEREQLALKRRVVVGDLAWWARLRVTPDNATDHRDVPPLRYLGGVDISFVKGDNVNACAALVVVELPSLEVVYEDCSHVQLTAPYIPGFLAFREVQFLVDKVRKLEETAPEFMPQVILCDGNGILHPREFGVACHLGVLLDLPTLGAAKKLFQVDGLENNEEHKQKIQELEKANDSFPLVGQSGRTLGMAVRSNAETRNPIYISPGHQLSIDTAVWVVQQCCPYRVPEPIRQADLRSREFLRQLYPEERPEQQKQKPRQKPKQKPEKKPDEKPTDPPEAEASVDCVHTLFDV